MAVPDDGPHPLSQYNVSFTHSSVNMASFKIKVLGPNDLCNIKVSSGGRRMYGMMDYIAFGIQLQNNNWDQIRNSHLFISARVMYEH